MVCVCWGGGKRRVRSESLKPMSTGAGQSVRLSRLFAYRKCLLIEDIRVGSELLGNLECTFISSVTEMDSGLCASLGVAMIGPFSWPTCNT